MLETRHWAQHSIIRRASHRQSRSTNHRMPGPGPVVDPKWVTLPSACLALVPMSLLANSHRLELHGLPYLQAAIASASLAATAPCTCAPSAATLASHTASAARIPCLSPIAAIGANTLTTSSVRVRSVNG